MLTEDTGDVVVRLDGVRKEYGETVALDGMSLEIRAGEAVAVMGPSGCGKSTLLNMIAGLDRPTSGTIVVHGENVGELSEKGLALYRRRRIGMVFQFFNLIDDLSALDNVALAAQLHLVRGDRPRVVLSLALPTEPLSRTARERITARGHDVTPGAPDWARRINQRRTHGW